MKSFFFFLALFFPVFSSANTIFYQPQNADQELVEADWEKIFSETRRAGFTRILVQWSRYGDADFGGTGGWLESAVEIAHANGLQVVLGLYSDPEFFNRVRGTDFQVAAYLNVYLIKNLRMLDELVAGPLLGKVSGWYLPAEFDDRYWHSAARQKMLRDQLEKWDTAVAKRTTKPWSTTSFFTGWQSPVSYAQWLRGFNYDIWVQDGSGTGVLTETQRAIYLTAIDKDRNGVIIEAFRQLDDRREFLAEPKDPQVVLSLEKTYRGLGFQQVGYFSLRYMPFARSKLCGSCKS